MHIWSLDFFDFLFNSLVQKYFYTNQIIKLIKNRMSKKKYFYTNQIFFYSFLFMDDSHNELQNYEKMAH